VVEVDAGGGQDNQDRSDRPAAGLAVRGWVMSRLAAG